MSLTTPAAPVCSTKKDANKYSRRVRKPSETKGKLTDADSRWYTRFYQVPVLFESVRHHTFLDVGLYRRNSSQSRFSSSHYKDLNSVFVLYLRTFQNKITIGTLNPQKRLSRTTIETDGLIYCHRFLFSEDLE